MHELYQEKRTFGKHLSTEKEKKKSYIGTLYVLLVLYYNTHRIQSFRFDENTIKKLSLTTNDKMVANHIFDLKYGVFGQKKFSWIYMGLTSLAGYPDPFFNVSTLWYIIMI
jgi:hypothetical protein